MLASPDVAAALGVDVGSALIALTRSSTTATASGVEHLSALYRPDRYAFRMDLVRTQDRNGRPLVACSLRRMAMPTPTNGPPRAAGTVSEGETWTMTIRIAAFDAAFDR